MTLARCGIWRVHKDGASPVSPIPNPQPLAPRARCRRHPARSAFTLVELLITVSIIAIMATMVLFAAYSAQEMARAQRTKALIARLDAIIKAKYESYRYRRVPTNLQDEGVDRSGDGTLQFPGEIPDVNSNGSLDPGIDFADFNGDGLPTLFTAPLRSKIRIDALREVMRMELPDRLSDIMDDPVTPLGFPVPLRITRPAVSQAYLRRVQSAANPPTGEFIEAECLYMIITQAQQEDADDRSSIKAESIADTDGDGFPEFVDGWGQPIRFLRWAPGFISDLHVVARGRHLSFTRTASDPTHLSTLQCDSTQNPMLSKTPGSYVGGTVVITDATWTQPDHTNMARITGYTFDPSPTAPEPKITIHCDTSTVPSPILGGAVTQQRPFDPALSTGPGFFMIAPPDPFDPAGIYPLYNPGAASWPGPTDPSKPSYALYPLIYSSGPDKCYGIRSDMGSGVQYSNIGVNPFFVSGTEMIGDTADISTERFFVSRGWIDNIHNHLISTR